MIKELKYFFFIFTIFLFLFFIGRYYFSDQNKKESYRSINQLNEKIDNFSKNLVILKSDTENIIEYAENVTNKEKKKYHFWQLILNNE